ncbi:hypothetical protein V1512DRAFT_256074 [Lipomyces arxii]|uniref:uncharacterized protein n=1 Tax=Lipomyces arxii TaxID=56418 RepID=UPI0034CD9F5B
MRNKFRPKHQRLILQCYPGGRSQEKHPNSSELSYLLYYVSTRRTKLPKVGRFLERKVRSDVWRGRSGNVQVTLDITKALIDKCANDLNVYADFLISILTTVLNSNDLALCQYTSATFTAFCEHHDGGLLVDDKDFVRRFMELLELYMTAGSKSTTPQDSGWTLVRLSAAKSVSASEALGSQNGQTRQQIQIIAPVILAELYSESDNNLLKLDSKVTMLETPATDQRTPRTSTNTLHPAVDNGVDTDDVSATSSSVIAMQALRRLFDTDNDTNESQIRLATHAVVDFIMAHPGNEAWARTMVDLMARWTPVQLRFVILRSLLEVMASISIKEIKKHLVITTLVGSLLSSRVNLAGLLVSDVLHVLFSQILRLLNLGKDAGAVEMRDQLLSQLVYAIGGLATHIYYSDQISDMVSEILVRMRPISNMSDGGSSSPPQSSEPPSTATSYVHLDRYIRRDARTQRFNHKPALLVALKVVKEILKVANMMESGVKRNIVPLSSWTKTEWALIDQDADIKFAYASALLTYFSAEVDPDASGFKVKDGGRARTEFLAQLHLTLYDYCLQPGNGANDFLTINAILVTVADKLGLLGIMRGLPMVLRLQEVVHSTLVAAHAGAADRPKLPARNLVSLDSIILSYYGVVAKKLGVPELGARVAAEIAGRKASGQWDSGISVPPKFFPPLGPGETVKAKLSLGDGSEEDDGDESVDLGQKTHVDRAVVTSLIEDAGLTLPDGVLQELVGDWNRESVLRDESDPTQSSIADTDGPLILHVVSRRRARPNRPVRSAW